MYLVHNWRAVLTRAWSMRLMALAALCGGLEAMLPGLEGILPPRLFAWLSVLATGGAFIARLVAQRGLSHPNGDDEDEVWG